jgi:hypothetical protein
MARADLLKFSTLWDNEKNIAIEISREFETSELQSLVEMMVEGLPNNFLFAVLETLAERPYLTASLQNTIFIKGDVGCKTSICLRDDLDDNLKQKCSECKDDDVREHYLQKQAQEPL